MNTNRREFFRVVLGTVAAGIGLAKAPAIEWRANVSGLPGFIGGIDRSTYPWWRNTALQATEPITFPLDYRMNPER